MDNHPIPQDVTGFQFRLIGDMTVKQFAYLAAGAIIASIIYILPLLFLIKYPLIVLFALLGVALAFLPIEGRPVDVMLANFIKALFVPNQYLYQKVGGQLSITSLKNHLYSPKQTQPHLGKEDLERYIGKISTAPKNKLDEKEMLRLESLFPAQPPQPKWFNLRSISHAAVLRTAPKPTMQAQPQKIYQDDKKTLEKETDKLQKEIGEAGKQEMHELPPAQPSAQPPTQAENAQHEKTTELEKQLQDVTFQKQKLEEQLSSFAGKVATQQPAQQPVYTASSAQSKAETPNVRKIPKAMGVKIGLPIAPDFPNLITGIIKDSRGNILPNILVEIRDADGNPIRAFKTNQLGQFKAATPLLNGVYTIEFEDPQGAHRFDAIELTTTGEIIEPLEIISTDQREELRKELFRT